MTESQVQELENLIDEVSVALESHDDTRLNELLADQEPAGLAHLLESFPQDVRATLWRHTGEEADAETLLHMSEDAAEQLAEDLGIEAIVEAAEDLDATEIAELVEVLPGDVSEDLLAAMDSLRREQVEAVLSFEEDSAGRLMHRDTVTVRADAALSVVQRYLARLRDVPDNTDIYLSPFILHRTADYWPEPERFDPDRFAEGRLDKNDRPYFPFSLGPRRCLGEYFSFVEMKVHLGLLLPRFRMMRTDDTEPGLELAVNLRSASNIWLKPAIRTP